MSNPTADFFPVGPEVEPELLARIASLTLKPAPVELIGPRVRLIATEPERDAPSLYPMSNGQPIQLGERSIGEYDPAILVWRYLAYGPFKEVAECKAYLDTLCGYEDIRPMTLIDHASGQPIGILTFMSNVPRALKIEIGHIWISPVMQGSGVIYEACYLMLRHCFELGYRRLEWKCDSLNERSRRTALNLGFQFEGIQEFHGITRGHSRDTAWYRILNHEWPQICARLEQRLGI